MSDKNTGDCRTCAFSDGVTCSLLWVGIRPRHPLFAVVNEWTTDYLMADLMTRTPEAPPCPGHKERQ
jgi:hypothetical protein